MIRLMIKRKGKLSFLLFENQRGLSTKELEHLSPTTLLKQESQTDCIARLKQMKLPRIKNNKVEKAAVLVPLCVHNDKLGLLYTLRSYKVSTNRGQVSFPGGMADEKDSSPQETALRETWEELRIAESKIKVWGCGNWVERKDVQVMPVVAFVGEIDPNRLEINRQEVEEAFVQPLEKLCDPELYGYTQFRAGYTLPVYFGGSHRIWGLTAMITHMVMNALAPQVYKNKLRSLKPILETGKEDTVDKKT